MKMERLKLVPVYSDFRKKHGNVNLWGPGNKICRICGRKMKAISFSPDRCNICFRQRS